MNYMDNINKFNAKMEKLDKLITEYNEGVGSSNAAMARDMVMEGTSVGDGDSTSAVNFNSFTMFIDMWGTSERKVGQ